MDVDSAEPQSAARVRRTRTVDEVDSGDVSSRAPKRQKTGRTPPNATAANLLRLAESNVSPNSLASDAIDGPSLARISGKTPMELVVFYDHSSLPSALVETTVRELHTADSEQALSLRLFQAMSYVLCELGSHAVNTFWHCALSDLRDGRRPSTPWIIRSTPADPARVELAINNVIGRWSVLRTSDCSRFPASPKLVKLYDLLGACQPYGDSFRGVIIVRGRIIARILTELLNGLDYVHCAAVHSTGFPGNPEQQQEVFRSFSAGTYNVLVVTHSAEDLDIPEASIVIRFDLIDSDVCYAYARSRCIGRDSHLVHMAERDNGTHRRILSRITNMGDEMRRWTEKAASDPGSAVPPKTLHDTSDSGRFDSDDEDDSTPYITEPITGSRISPLDGTAVLYRYLARMQTEGSSIHNGPHLFDFREVCQPGGKAQFICVILLTEGTPISNVSSLPCMSMAEARRAACFEACSQLFQQGVLDYRLFPIPTDRFNPTTEHGQTATAAVSTAGTHRYARKAPDFWRNTLASAQSMLYPTVIAPGSLHDEIHAPVLILTRLPVPEFTDFSVYSSGSTTTICLHRGAPLNVDPEQLGLLHGYTLRICRAIMNKEFSCPLESMAYFFAPLAQTWVMPDKSSIPLWRLPTVDVHIPWDLVRLAADKFATSLLTDEATPIDRCVEDAVVQDRWVEFTNRFFVVRVRHDLTPLSKANDSPREGGYANFVEHCKARRKEFEGLKNYNQPMIEILPVPTVVNCLNPTSAPSMPASRTPAKYLIPELCAKFTIPASTLRTLLLLPAITRRIDDMLLVKELNAHFFAHSILEHHLLAALSPPSACVQHDYERLELLGDTFLKYVSSLHCFVTMPAQASGLLHRARERIISNKALLEGATRTGLPPYIQSKPFVAKLWVPILSAVDANRTTNAHDTQMSQTSGGGKRSKRNKQKEGQNIQWLGDKTVADVVEAIIGAAYLSGGQDLALNVTKILDVALPGIENWSDFVRTAQSSSNSNVLQMQTVTAVEAITGYHFKLRHLLAQALTHASIKGKNICSYDRLEFLGDAVLDYLVVRYIFRQHPHLSPGGLTLLKSAMVSNHALAALCVHIALHTHIQHAQSDLAASIRSYAENIKTQRTQEHQLAKRENRLPCQYWLEIEPPKILSDVVESIIGALYVSDEFSDTGAQMFFDNVLKPFYDQHIRLQTLSVHPNATLFHWLQAEGCHQHRLLKEVEGQTIRYNMLVHDVVLASAAGATAAVAVRRASMCALDALEGDPGFLTRTCDCRATHQGKKAKKDQPQARLGYDVEE